MSRTFTAIAGLAALIALSASATTADENPTAQIQCYRHAWSPRYLQRQSCRRNRPGGNGALYRNDRGCGVMSQPWRLLPTPWRDNQAANPGHHRAYRSAAPTHARGFSSPCGRGDAERLAVQNLNAGAAAIRPPGVPGALGRAAPTRLCGVDGRDCPTRASMQPEARSMTQP
jgi:hypothetical protein